jgi:hypothetical protein
VSALAFALAFAFAFALAHTFAIAFAASFRFAITVAAAVTIALAPALVLGPASVRSRSFLRRRPSQRIRLHPLCIYGAVGGRALCLHIALLVYMLHRFNRLFYIVVTCCIVFIGCIVLTCCMWQTKTNSDLGHVAMYMFRWASLGPCDRLHEVLHVAEFGVLP